MKPFQLFTKCQVCGKEGEVPAQPSFLGGTNIFIPDGWWKIGEAHLHEHSRDEECPARDYIVCQIECIARLAEMLTVEEATK